MYASNLKLNMTTEGDRICFFCFKEEFNFLSERRGSNHLGRWVGPTYVLGLSMLVCIGVLPNTDYSFSAIVSLSHYCSTVRSSIQVKKKSQVPERCLYQTRENSLYATRKYSS
jgi:hypothetical protein